MRAIAAPARILLTLCVLLCSAQWGGAWASPPGTEEAAPSTDAQNKGRNLSSVVEYKRHPFRDPFRSLKEPRPEEGGPRPPGPPGMLIEEIDVVGMLAGPQGAMVLIVGNDGLGYALSEGSQLYDGKVLRIDEESGTIYFRQKVNDPNRIKPYRDIERQLDAGS